MNWHHVNNSLPPAGEVVLVTDGRDCWTASYAAGQWTHDDAHDDIFGEVTHWVVPAIRRVRWEPAP
jgi:hypothetical protein